MKPIKYAISYVIYNEDRTRFLTVQRPSNDNDLPNAWGLPAGSVRNDETFEEAIRRSGIEKLGVKLEPVRFIGRGNVERTDYVLHMEEYEAKIIDGEPSVPQSVEGVTQYQQWNWGVSNDLRDAASKGSLCSQIFLEKNNETKESDTIV